jgi:hypothetical protein
MACFVQLEGGLGNQLFQVAAAWAHCKRNGFTLQISKGTKGGRGTYWTSVLQRFAGHIGDLQQGPLWHEPRFAYTPIPREARNLFGYFQSSRYFAEYAEELRELFDLSETVDYDLSDAVAVHIRLGDYFTRKNRSFHGIVTQGYYERAIAKFPGKRILVLSDNLAACRTWPFLQEAIFVDESDVVCLSLMSRAPNLIMSNSSFSWWGVFLGAPKRVISPARWFGPSGPQDYEDIYEPSWEKMAV